MKRFLVVIAILVAAAACGGAAGGGGASSSTGSAHSSQPNRSSTDAGSPSKSTTAPVGTGSALPNDNVPTLQGPPVIRQAQLTVTVGAGTFDSKLSEVRRLVEAQGGYIAGTDAQAGPTSDAQGSQIRTGVINFMVPAAHFDEAIDELAKVGKLQSEHIAGTDVSAQYVDLRARLANAEAQRNAMLALLTQAKNINDIIAVQNQIGAITGQIEQLKGQIKYLDDNTSYSQVTLTLSESGAPAQAKPADSWGFATALSDAAHNFVTTINYAITALGAVGPFLVLALLGYIVWRRRRLPLPRRA